MDFLKDLQEKLEDEIFLSEKEEEEDMERDEEDNPEKKKGGRAITYRETQRKTKGKAFSIAYDVDYKELKDELDTAVPNVSWTIPKVRETFKAIRKYVGFSDPKKEKNTE